MHKLNKLYYKSLLICFIPKIKEKIIFRTTCRIFLNKMSQREYLCKFNCIANVLFELSGVDCFEVDTSVSIETYRIRDDVSFVANKIVPKFFINENFI